MKRVTAAILKHNGKILIAKRGGNDKLPNKWEFPGGKIEHGESPEECLRREMLEEFGIQVSIGQQCGESVYHYDHDSIKLLGYLTYWEDGKISAKVHDEYAWVSINALQLYDFAPADIPFVEALMDGKIEL